MKANSKEKIRQLMIKFIKANSPMAVTYPEADNYGQIWSRENDVLVGGYAHSQGAENPITLEQLSFLQLAILVDSGVTPEQNLRLYSDIISCISQEIIFTKSKHNIKTCKEIEKILSEKGWTSYRRSLFDTYNWFAPKKKSYLKVWQNGVNLRTAASIEGLCSDENLC